MSTPPRGRGHGRGQGQDHGHSEERGRGRASVTGERQVVSATGSSSHERSRGRGGHSGGQGQGRCHGEPTAAGDTGVRRVFDEREERKHPRPSGDGDAGRSANTSTAGVQTAAAVSHTASVVVPTRCPSAAVATSAAFAGARPKSIESLSRSAPNKVAKTVAATSAALLSASAQVSTSSTASAADSNVGRVTGQLASRLALTSGPADNPLDRQLKDRLQQLRLTARNVSKASTIVNKVTDVLKKALNHITRIQWDTLKSGSYYDKTKITQPDEFDIMLTCAIPADPIFAKSPSPNYCTLSLNTDNWHPDLETTTRDGKFVCPKAFNEWFREQVSAVVICHLQTDDSLGGHKFEILPHESGKSPAVTIKITTVEGFLSIDIVPAVRLVAWPQPASNWRVKWLSSEDGDKLRTNACVVAKIDASEMSKSKRECKFWRLSFSATEKEMIKYADSDEKTCRKDVLRLLKKDLDAFNHDKPSNEKVLCSYHMKTVWFHCLDKKPKHEMWQNTGTTLRQRYVDALKQLIDCFDKRSMRHYFVKSVNLIDTSASAVKWAEAKSNFTKIHEQFK